MSIFEYKKSGKMFLVLFFLGGTLSGCASKEDSVLKPDPQYFVTLHGVIAPQLQKEVHLRFIQIYEKQGRSCDMVNGSSTNFVGNTTKFVSYLVTPNPETGNYQVSIPIDYFKSGHCRWQPTALSYTLTDQEYKSNPKGFELLSYDNKASLKYNPAVFNFVCPSVNFSTSDGTDNCTVSIPSGSGALIYARAHESFDQELNIVALNQQLPQVNPNQKYFLTITGYITTHLRKKIDLSFLESFSATDSSCINKTDRLADINSASSKTDIYKAETNAVGAYVIHIPLDNYLPDKCKWKLKVINYAVTVNGVSPIPSEMYGQNFIEFNDDTQEYNSHEYDLLCKHGLNSCVMVVQEGYTAYPNLTATQSDSMNFNLLNSLDFSAFSDP